MNKKLTIEDVKKKKVDLELAVMKLINDFEEECGVKVSYIHFNRYRERDTVPEVVKPNEGKVENVEANMELDLLY